MWDIEASAGMSGDDAPTILERPCPLQAPCSERGCATRCPRHGLRGAARGPLVAVIAQPRPSLTGR
jgi:hypothetical protein